jgi:AraC-like DNA-binding protein
MGYFYPRATDSIVDSALSEARIAAAHSMNNIDTQLCTVYNIPNIITQNDRITRWAMENDTLTRLDAASEIRQIVGGSTLIYDIFIYLRNKPYFVSGYSSTVSAENTQLYKGKYGIYYEKWSYDEMFETLNAAQMQVAHPAEPVVINNVRTPDMITFVQSIPPNNRYAYATTMIFIPGSKLRDLMVDVYKPGTQFALINAQRESIYTSKNMPDDVREQVLALSQNEKNGVRELAVSGEKQIVAWASSKYNGWLYIFTTPYDHVISNIEKLQRNTLVMNIGLGVLLALLVSMFMRVNYRPLGKLASLAQGITDDTENGKKSVTHFQVIRKAIELLQYNNSNLATQLDDARPKLKERAMQSLLAQDPENGIPEQLHADLAQAGIPPDLHTYQVAILSYSDPSEYLRARLQLEDAKPPSLLSLSQMAGQATLIVLLGDAGDSEDLLAPLEAAMPPQEPLFKNAWIGAGCCVHALERVIESYAKAYIALDNARIRGQKGLIHRFSSLPDPTPCTHNSPLSMMQALSFAVLQRDIDTISSLVHKIVTSMQNDNLPPYHIRSMFYNTVSLLMDGLNQETGAGPLNDETVHMLSTQYTTGEMVIMLFDLVQKFGQLIKEKYRDADNTPMAKALQFIEKHIEFSSLSLTDVAEKCDMSPTYLSHMFKQKTGRNFKEYVDALRLEKAKDLLQNTNEKITDIAKKVGYDNSYSFSRFFKNNLLITPKEYRDTKRKSDRR